MSDAILHWHSLPGSIVPLKVQEDKSAKSQTDSSRPVHGARLLAGIWRILHHKS